MEKTTLKQGEMFSPEVMVVNGKVRIKCDNVISMLLDIENAGKLIREIDAACAHIEAERQQQLPHRSVTAVAMEGNPMRANKKGHVE